MFKVSAGILSPVFGTAPKNVVQQEIIQSKAIGMIVTCEKRLVRVKKQRERVEGQNMIKSQRKEGSRLF